MRIVFLVITAAIGISAFAPAADARPRSKEQDAAFRATKEGHIMPLRVIEAVIVPRMGGATYLGPELEGERYRLKFLREGQVIWIDVDARTGRITGRSQ
ncbi:MAG TPA: hypothetical protein VGR19_11670 [Allosphingosinicella sp.]|nr:hypothetical protein [Allosphingosinicella sp.]